MRMIASLARVDQTKIRTGQNLDEIEWNKIASVVGMFKQKNNLSHLLKLLKQRRLPTWNHYKNM